MSSIKCLEEDKAFLRVFPYWFNNHHSWLDILDIMRVMAHEINPYLMNKRPLYVIPINRFKGIMFCPHYTSMEVLLQDFEWDTKEQQYSPGRIEYIGLPENILVHSPESILNVGDKIRILALHQHDYYSGREERKNIEGQVGVFIRGREFVFGQNKYNLLPGFIYEIVEPASSEDAVAPLGSAPASEILTYSYSLGMNNVQGFKIQIVELAKDDYYINTKEASQIHYKDILLNQPCILGTDAWVTIIENGRPQPLCLLQGFKFKLL